MTIEAETVFVDTNIFMYLAGDDPARRNGCRSALHAAVERRVTLTTSAEVLQEILHPLLLDQSSRQRSDGLPRRDGDLRGDSANHRAANRAGAGPSRALPPVVRAQRGARRDHGGPGNTPNPLDGPGFRRPRSGGTDRSRDDRKTLTRPVRGRISTRSVAPSPLSTTECRAAP